MAVSGGLLAYGQTELICSWRAASRLLPARAPFERGRRPILKSRIPPISRQRGSIPKNPSGDPHVPLIPTVPGKRLVVPKPVRRSAARQLDQQCSPDIIRTIRRADWPAEDEAVAIRREV